jgi:hypothetical protein
MVGVSEKTTNRPAYRRTDHQRTKELSIINAAYRYGVFASCISTVCTEKYAVGHPLKPFHRCPTSFPIHNARRKVPLVRAETSPHPLREATAASYRPSTTVQHLSWDDVRFVIGETTTLQEHASLVTSRPRCEQAEVSSVRTLRTIRQPSESVEVSIPDPSHISFDCRMRLLTPTPAAAATFQLFSKRGLGIARFKRTT